MALFDPSYFCRSRWVLLLLAGIPGMERVWRVMRGSTYQGVFLNIRMRLDAEDPIVLLPY